MLAKTAALWRGLWLINAWHMEVPEMGVPPVIIHFSRIFHEINQPFLDTPIDGNPHIMLMNRY